MKSGGTGRKRQTQNTRRGPKRVGTVGMSISDIVLAILASGGGAAVVAAAIFRFLGVSWLESKFNQQLENFRHENAKELAQLNASVDGALSKTVKSQEKEFEVLSEMWRLANVAHGTIGGFISPLQSYADVTKMSEQKLREFLEQFELLPSIVEEIVRSSDQMAEFEDAIFWHKRNRSSKALNEFRNFVYLNEVFIEESVAEEFKWVATNLNDVFVAKEIAKEDGDRKYGRDAHKKYVDEIGPRLVAIAPTLREKFFERV